MHRYIRRSNPSKNAGAVAILVVALGACTGDRSGAPPSANVLLEPPPPGEGFQVVTDSFTVAAGEEVTDCYFFEVPLPAGERYWADSFEIATAAGSHHANLYLITTQNELSVGKVDGDVVYGGLCNTGAVADWPILINTQLSGETFQWDLPDGSGMEVEGGALVMLQVHYANASDTTQKTPGPASVAANVYVTEAEPETKVGFHAGRRRDLRVCPGETITWTQRCKFPMDRPRTVIAANGHFHQRGKRFTATLLSPEDFDIPLGETNNEPFYESLLWDEADMATGLEVLVEPGGGVEFACEFEAREQDCGDPEDACCFSWGNQTQRAEHCVLFAHVMPAEDVVYVEGIPDNPELAIDCDLDDPTFW